MEEQEGTHRSICACIMENNQCERSRGATAHAGNTSRRGKGDAVVGMRETVGRTMAVWTALWGTGEDLAR
jgi:hypothetical protein